MVRADRDEHPGGAAGGLRRIAEGDLPARGTLILQTARLRLRELTDEDAPFVLGLLNEPSFISNIGDRGVRNIEDAQAYIANGPRASYAQHGYGLFMVERREDGIAIGICGLLRRAGLGDTDLGYALLPAWWGKGYAFEAAGAVRDWGFREAGLTRLVAIVVAENQPSIRVLDRLGFRFERMIQLAAEGPELRLYACGTDAPAGDLRDSTL